MLHRKKLHVCSTRGSALIILVILICLMAWPVTVPAQPDICGCAGNINSKGAFDSSDNQTFPDGTDLTGNTITIPLPDDGVLIFDSFTISLSPNGGSATVKFEPNAGNTPVTLLVAGDVTINSGTLSVSGENGTAGSNNLAGIGGMGGPGGFRGGDGAYQYVNHEINGGAGFGPGGGEAGIESSIHAGNGAFIGIPELLPMIGGSGGGGGASPNTDYGESAGGGGGGGGAILIVANGTITVNGTIHANGGLYGSSKSYSNAGNGGRGSGGAVRLVAESITGSGTIYARGYNTNDNSGAIRMEAVNNTFAPSKAYPLATRVPAPGPISNPLTYSVSITEFNGDPVPDPPAGGFGEMDFTMDTPGVASITLETSGVPGGTTVLVTVKPRIGGTPTEYNVTLDPDNCSGGNCTANVAFDLASGKYVIEAQATFQTP